jgi:hypothetical protein
MDKQNYTLAETSALLTPLGAPKTYTQLLAECVAQDNPYTCLIAKFANAEWDDSDHPRIAALVLGPRARAEVRAWLAEFYPPAPPVR